MADTKLSALTSLSSVASNDSLLILDVSDTTDSPQGSSRQITKANLVKDITLTTDVTGVLPVANGGTGLSTITSGTVMLGNGTSAPNLVSTTGTGNFVRASTPTITSPTLITPSLGVATATSINGIVIGPATSASFDIANNKTVNINNTLTLAGTDGTTLTFPSATDTIVGRTSTDTLTNKRITRRVGTTTSSATPTINTDNVDFYSITALSAAITSFTTNLSGTPTNAQTLWISITDNGTARAITWGSSFEASGNVALPTTTVISTRLDVLFGWNTVTSKWRCLAVS